MDCWFIDGIKVPVRLFCCSSRVQPFVQKVIICLNCLRTNHRTANCRSAKRCQRCSERHDDMHEYDRCERGKKCANCRNTDHTTTDPDCPETKRQQKIKKLMSKKNLTYAEAKEQIPIENNNMYEALYDAEEFPTPAETFADKTKSSFPWKDPLREQWMLTNNERKQNQAAVYMGKPPTDNKKRKQSTNSERITEKRNNIFSCEGAKTTSGVALNNNYRVDEKERWETISKQIMNRAQNEQQNLLMTFYTDFIAQLNDDETTKEKFMACTKRHFNFAKSVIHHTVTK